MDPNISNQQQEIIHTATASPTWISRHKMVLLALIILFFIIGIYTGITLVPNKLQLNAKNTNYPKALVYQSTLGTCSWAPVADAAGYHYTVTDTKTGKVIKDDTTDKYHTNLSFSTQSGGSYSCNVEALKEQCTTK